MYFPEDITRDILLRLPVKSLLRFACVCNSWRYLILSDQFIDSHTKFGRQMEIIISTDISPYNCFAYCPDYKILESCFQSMTLCNIFQLNNYYEVIGHCNGLICLSWCPSRMDCILLWNPALRQCRVLLPINLDADFTGFGYDVHSQDYKVVIIFYRPFEFRPFRVMMYSLKNDMWKSINCSSVKLVGYDNFRVYGSLFEGRLYWFRLGHLLVFDLAKEDFFEFDLSHTFNVRDQFIGHTLGIFRGCISLLVNTFRRYEIWSMEDRNIPESWSKVYDGIRGSWTGLTMNGKLFANVCENGEHHFILYNVETQRRDVHKRKEIPTVRSRWYVISDFIETLVGVIPKVTPRQTPRQLTKWNW